MDAMRSVLIIVALFLLIAWSIGVGAYLVVHGHPWFAALCIVAGCSISYTRSSSRG